MQLEDYFDFLAADDIRIKGTRVGIETVLFEHLSNGRTPEQIVQHYPTLALDRVYATILYYLTHREAVDAYLDDLRRFSRRMREEQARNPHPGVVRLRQLMAERRASKPTS